MKYIAAQQVIQADLVREGHRIINLLFLASLLDSVVIPLKKGTI